MIGRSGFHGLLRHMKTSPWTRRALTESFLLNRANNRRLQKARPDVKAAEAGAPPPASPTSHSWIASITAALRRAKSRAS
jgi:hypothetical protein